jgi:hypothetical protein
MVLLASRDDARPHLYVFADPLPDDTRRAQRNRRVMCELLADWMSGRGQRPAWLDDFEPRGESAAEALTGAMIVATGPWLRSRRPGDFRLDQRPAAKAMRKALIASVLAKPDSQAPGAGQSPIDPGAAL